ncbi:hypothetical protein HZH66_005117 [Vespula vulgaris]|uniref:Uncharacterized protein n=1 Tax=Vespula vulgaris TaxID=7454 RepID=A0A834KAC2_VESVU|nr:hypothetical protein HZH66_005117 [Vespula vulgaris]
MKETKDRSYDAENATAKQKREGEEENVSRGPTGLLYDYYENLAGVGGDSDTRTAGDAGDIKLRAIFRSTVSPRWKPNFSSVPPAASTDASTAAAAAAAAAATAAATLLLLLLRI